MDKKEFFFIWRVLMVFYLFGNKVDRKMKD